MFFTQEANHNPTPRARTTFKSVERKEYREGLRLLRLRTISVSGAAFASPEKYHKTASRFHFCGSSVRLNEWADNSTGEVKQTFSGGQFCGQRLCPSCQHHKARILCEQVGKVYKRHAEKAPDSIGVLLTLTMRNCQPEDLREALRDMHHAFGKLRRRVEFETSVRGYFRASEVTVSEKEGRTYHPHMHVLLMVPRAYLRKSSGMFITQERWVQMWQDCLSVDYRPIVDVRAVTPEAMAKRKGRKGGALTMAGAIREVAKYCVKPDGYQEILPSGRFFTQPEVFQELQEGLRGLRLHGWGGDFDEIRKELELKDVDSADINIEEELADIERPAQNFTLIAQVVYAWDSDARRGWGDYVEQYRRSMTGEDDTFNAGRFRGGG